MYIYIIPYIYILQYITHTYNIHYPIYIVQNRGSGEGAFCTPLYTGVQNSRKRQKTKDQKKQKTKTRKKNKKQEN